MEVMKRSAWSGSWLLLVLLLLTLQHAPEVTGQGPRAERPRSVLSRGKGPATYWVTFSKVIRAGMKLPVTVGLASPTVSSDVSVKLMNKSANIVAEAPLTTVKGGSSIIHLDLPNHMDTSYRSKYVLHVSGSGEVKFNQSLQLRAEAKSFSIFVQTDKAKYKPGQTVKFRVLAMNPNLTIRVDPMDIFVRDANNNAMKMWRQVKGVHGTGVVEKTFPTSKYASQGDWEIAVTVMGQTETKKFTIEEYVLPKFEAALEMPHVVHTSESALKGKVLAKYTFGKPLTKATATVTVKMPYFYRKNKNISQPMLTTSGRLDKNGEFPFSFFKTQLLGLVRRNNNIKRTRTLTEKDLNYQQFVVVVNVTDVQSMKSMSAEQKVRFTGQKVKIKFLSSTPKTYKAGLRFPAQVRITKFDDSLFENFQDIEVTFNFTCEHVTYYNMTLVREPEEDDKGEEKEKKKVVIPETRMRTETHVLTVVSKRLTANGYLAVDVDVPSNASMLNIVVKVLGEEMFHSAGQSESPSQNYVQIQAQEDNPKAGHETTVNIVTTEPVKRLIYQVLTKGMLVEEAEAEAVDEHRRNFTATFRVTVNMAPDCRVLAFYFRPDGEVVVDSLTVKIDTSSRRMMNVSFNKREVKPGEQVDMTVRTRPNSVVFLLSVDKSVKLLKSGNDITKDMVDEELLRYGYGSGFHSFWPLMRICGWPFPSLSKDADGVFMEARVAMLTDGYIHKKETAQISFMLKGTGPTRGIAGESTEESEADNTVERVRKFFPETWLFDAVLVGSDGKHVLSKTAPDTITTWLTSAFSVHPEYGLSVIPQPAELTTFRKLFVSLDLPYSAIRGEDLCMKAFAFNYYDRVASMRITMDYNAGIGNTRLVREQGSQIREYSYPRRTTHRIGKVFPNEVVPSTFCFTPLSLGNIPIRINLTATGLSGDGVERILKVKAEGQPRSITTSVVLDMDDKAEFTEVVPIKFPDNVVQGSNRITVAIAADLLSPVFDNLDDLLRMPYGCGEQNMLYFAPMVFVIDVQQRTNTYTPEVAEKAENYMLTGYQKELTYKHSDGSYSAFGQRPNSTESGSMWLTAFVTKCFAQAMALNAEVISVDEKVFKESVMWMVSQQTDIGSFPEPGKVFNKNMQGGSAEGEALTAYVLIALAETNRTAFNKMSEGERKNLDEVIVKGRSYLEQKLHLLTDSYDLCIVTYALHLTRSALADDAFKLLEAKAVKGDTLTTHWERIPEKKSEHLYWQRKTAAINIEMTAYSLLTYVMRNMTAKAMPIVRWMTQQRGPQGGFISTQDTVIGLQALAQVAVEIYQPHFSPINVSVHWGTDGMRNITLDDNNKQLLHKMELPVESITEVTIKARPKVPGNFSGMALAEVIQDYNEAQKNTSESKSDIYWMKIGVIIMDNHLLVLNASRVDGKEGGMTVVEVNLPTGYAVDQQDGLYNVDGTSMVQAESDSLFVLYYVEMGMQVMNATLPLINSYGQPVNTKSNVIRMYDYYESGGGQELIVDFDVDFPTSICSSQSEFGSCDW
ncbi:CD109 antigen-like isoform X2 [Babylonia areolata]|uniref:CD109 antigen-like isoform X2 n=1 Tax=Babylonia areolata TaxID=304850 RepID=UPI003FCEFE20